MALKITVLERLKQTVSNPFCCTVALQITVLDVTHFNTVAPRICFTKAPTNPNTHLLYSGSGLGSTLTTWVRGRDLESHYRIFAYLGSDLEPLGWVRVRGPLQ